MFENKIYEGIYYSIFIASFAKSGGNLKSGWRFKKCWAFTFSLIFHFIFWSFSFYPNGVV